MSQGPLPGFRDFYPLQFAERALIIDSWRDVARRHAFVEYDGPPLEPLELYTRKSGDEIVGQLYNFVDKGDREVALRPEMTPTFARMVAAQANALRKPVRWFSVPQLFRYERQQRGRLREHFQLNVDIVGEVDVTADAELLTVAIEVMRALGLTSSDVVARVSDRRLLNALLAHARVPDDALPVVYGVVDKMSRDPRAALEARMLKAGLSQEVAGRVFDLAGAGDLASLRTAYGGDAAVAEHIERLERYLSYLGALGVGEWVTFDLSIVRGLAYYSGIVFELFDAKGELRAICGGGRYDSLLAALGGVDLPALGFGMGDVVLGELLRQRGLLNATVSRPDYWVAGSLADADGVTDCMRIAAHLRARGRSVEYALRTMPLNKQLDAASRAGVAKAFIVRPAADGRPKHIVQKDMKTGSEEHMEFDAFFGGR